MIINIITFLFTVKLASTDFSITTVGNLMIPVCSLDQESEAEEEQEHGETKEIRSVDFGINSFVIECSLKFPIVFVSIVIEFSKLEVGKLLNICSLVSSSESEDKIMYSTSFSGLTSVVWSVL